MPQEGAAQTLFDCQRIERGFGAFPAARADSCAPSQQAGTWLALVRTATGLGRRTGWYRPLVSSDRRHLSTLGLPNILFATGSLRESLCSLQAIRTTGRDLVTNKC